MKVKISTIENTGLGAILKSWKESVIKTEWRTHPGWRLWRNRIEDRGKRTQNTAESAQNVKPRGGEKTGCKPGFLNPTTPVSQRMLQTLKQGTHKRTHHTPRQHRCSEPSQKHCLKTQQNPARQMWEKPFKRAQQRQGWGVGTAGVTRLHRGPVQRERGDTPGRGQKETLNWTARVLDAWEGRGTGDNEEEPGIKGAGVRSWLSVHWDRNEYRCTCIQ